MQITLTIKLNSFIDTVIKWFSYKNNWHMNLGQTIKLIKITHNYIISFYVHNIIDQNYIPKTQTL